MIIYYKLPSYPATTATLPFAKISSMRKRQLLKYYSRCADSDSKFSSFDEIPLEKRCDIDAGKTKTPEPNLDSKTLTKEASLYINEISRTVHTPGKKVGWFLKGETEKYDGVVLPETRRYSTLSKGTSRHGKLSTKCVRLVHCPVYIT